MSGDPDRERDSPDTDGEFVEGRDYYFENGLMVLTAGFLLKRGFCCDNGCRNCPYSDADRAAQSKKTSSS
jgi:hypothetical protein